MVCYPNWMVAEDYFRAGPLDRAFSKQKALREESIAYLIETIDRTEKYMISPSSGQSRGI
jgi:hypothetical protein